MDYGEKIEYENESSSLDFKATQYSKAEHEALIKDLMAMANASSSEEKLIIVGVKHLPDGSRSFHPIEDENFFDAAIYQQLICENIEPHLEIDYVPYRYNGNLFGIISIRDNGNPPYMLKKNYGKLRRGLCLVRKGSHQLPASRADYDAFYNQRSLGSRLHEKLRIGFQGTNFQKRIEISPVNSSDVPSKRNAAKIRRILNQRNSDPTSRAMGIAFSSLAFLNSPFEFTPYEKRSTEVLEKDLKSVNDTYAEDDRYEIYEEKAVKINFDIFNGNTEYIQDVHCIMEVPKIHGITIPKSIVKKPVNSMLAIDSLRLMQTLPDNYPNVEELEKKFVIRQDIGAVKHKVSAKLFLEDIRLVVLDHVEADTIPIKITLLAKNLPEPILEDMSIDIISSTELLLREDQDV